ncbi:MAG TPA: hypothetical protein VJR26_01910, partial [Candidatus Acidoferrales bacterium]|nr:hypothetical protein [Candidatus Acidoferrales bacterium]
SPDESVAPFGIAPAGEKLKIASAILGAFIDRFDRLKRERDPHRSLLLAVSVVFSIPDEFGHFTLSAKSYEVVPEVANQCTREMRWE